jgi:hypothetical protein
MASSKRHYHLSDTIYLSLNEADEIGLRSSGSNRLCVVPPTLVDEIGVALWALRAGMVTGSARQREDCETCAAVVKSPTRVESRILHGKLRGRWLSQHNCDSVYCDFCQRPETAHFAFMERSDGQRIIATCGLGEGCREN